jgi:hypothetical protein
MMKRISLSYLPNFLTKKDKKKQINMITSSRRLYKKQIYKTRKNITSFKSHKSPHVKNALKMYNIEKISPSKLLASRTGCSVESLKKIVKKGEGAYYSSGSRPNQTAKSWGLARLASSVTGGKASAYDYDILKNGCSHNKKAFLLARDTRKKMGWKTE